MVDEAGSPTTQKESTSKFASLLVPIRDLAGNWGIDIANDLEEYLAHLNRTAFSFDGGPSLDFAEAALLIQSSACVYSKKVEYLHNLAYQALETVRCRKRVGDAAEGGPEGGPEGSGPAQRAHAQERGEEDDSLETFLAAGLELKEADEKDLNLVWEDEDAATSGFVRAPAALLALEDQGCGSGDGDAGFYRLAQCHMHVSGALFLDAMEADAYDLLLNNSGRGSTLADMQAAMQQQWAVPGTQAGGRDDVEEEGDDDGGDAGGGGDDADEEDPQAAAAPAAAATQNPEAAGAGDAIAVHAAAGAALQGGAVAVGQPLDLLPSGTKDGGAGAGEGGAAAAEEEEEEQKVYDAFKPLDMHSKSNLPIKPLQVRRPAKGKALKPLAFAPRKPTTTNPAARTAAAAGLTHSEFAYGLQLLSGGCKQARPRAQGPQLLQHLHAFVGQSVLDAGDAAAAAAALQDVPEAGAEGEQGDRQEAAAWDDDDDDDDDDDGGVAGDDDDADEGGLDALDLMHDINANRGISAWAEDGGAGGAEGGNSYEDLCRAHIEAMVNAAAAQEVQSELTQRVSGWRSKIDPVLKDEEGRSNFDIQMYGERIIKRLQQATAQPDEAEACSSRSSSSSQRVAGFEAVAKEDVLYEVSRTFAAMLQLINNRNIELVRDGNDPDAPFRLQLLMTQLPHKRMGEALQGNLAQGQEFARLQEEAHAEEPEGALQAASKRPPKKKAKNVAEAQ